MAFFGIKASTHVNMKFPCHQKLEDLKCFLLAYCLHHVFLSHIANTYISLRKTVFFVSSSLCVLNTIMEEYKRLPLLAMSSLSYYYI
jgi:hypothetical protein